MINIFGQQIFNVSLLLYSDRCVYNNCYLPFKTHKEWKKTIMIHNTNLNPPVSSQKLANLETLMEQQFTTIGAYWLPLQIDGCTRHFATAAVWLMVVWVALHNWQLQWWSDDHQWKRWSLRIVMSLIHIVFSMLIISFDLFWYGVAFPGSFISLNVIDGSG